MSEQRDFALVVSGRRSQGGASRVKVDDAASDPVRPEIRKLRRIVHAVEPDGGLHLLVIRQKRDLNTLPVALHNDRHRRLPLAGLRLNTGRS